MKAEPRHLADPVLAVALSGGLGLVPWMPGTFGAAGALPLALLILPLPWAWQVAAAGLLFLLGCGICGRAARRLGVEDHPAIVWDETAGMLIALVLVPATPLAWLLAFLAFRILDINKPWLIGQAEALLRGGLAIMADDGLAGLGAAALVWPCLGLLSLFATA